MATARRSGRRGDGDGDVLVCGGTSTPGSAGGEVASSELFDPLFRLSKTLLPQARERLTATRLGIENAIVIGGRNFTGRRRWRRWRAIQGANDAFSQVGALATALTTPQRCSRRRTDPDVSAAPLHQPTSWHRRNFDPALEP